MPQSTVDVSRLYAALNQKRQKLDVSWRELANDLDISPSTFTRMAQGNRPDVDAFATLIDWLGVPIDAFLEPKSRENDPDPIVMISTYLRSAKNVRPEDAEALEDIIQAAYRRLVRD